MVAPQPVPDRLGQVNATPSPCDLGSLLHSPGGTDMAGGGCLCGPFLPDANMMKAKDSVPPATEALRSCFQAPWGPVCRPAQLLSTCPRPRLSSETH